MSLELLIVAPDDRGMSLSEIDRRLGDRALWRHDVSDGRSLSLSAPAHAASAPDEQVAALSLEIPTPVDSQLATETLLFAEDIAARLGWRVLEPVSGAWIDASDRKRWVSELVAYVDEEGQPLSADTWLSAAFEQPVWLMILLAVLAFGAASAIVLIGNVRAELVGTALGGLGTIFLVALLFVSGAWRSRKSSTGRR